MDRFRFAASVLGASAAAVLVPHRGLAGGTPVPPMPFLYDLAKAQAQAVDAVQTVHEKLGHDGSVGDFDDAYTHLAAKVNGFLQGVAIQLRLNQMDPGQWKSDATKILAQIDSFNETIANIAHPQAGGTRAGKPVAAGAGGGGGAQIQLNIDPVKVADSFAGWIDNVQKFHQNALKLDDQERAAAADVVEKAQWPSLCQLSLASGPCPPQPAKPFPVSTTH
jgi:hypothetical protein